MIKLAVPDVGQEELEEIKKVFDSKYLVQGNKVEEFENQIKNYLNIKHAIAVSSGTAALHLALLAVGLEIGDEVIVPDFTFPATANVVEIIGASIKFVDITLDSYCIDTEKIKSMITNKTKAVIPVHEFGQTADMDMIMDLAKKYNLKVIEDAACALGAEYKFKKAGTIGDIGCFSLHPRKAITTGEGGIVVTNNDELADKIKILRNHGIKYIDGKAKFVTAGLNYRMTNIQGAIATVQMKKLEEINNKKIKLAMEYNQILKKIKGITLPKEKSYGKHAWQTYHILLNEEINRDELIKSLKDNGIETNIGAYALHGEPYYKKKYRYENYGFNNSINAYKHGMVLPLHKNISIEEISYVALVLEKILNER
ncbi:MULTISPECIES: DegT/DnrJ/EryC1/StrS family aminotransferase [unclassified Clostridium]|uniref:DegT/DnrJ/EryC1/StrS family aminotransferase n=1 Tax=unclassified Clostridium TaxID=2614128 RepID=UPI00029865E2|nr:MULTISPECIES: DegT/DnrJ/EryC1/StrS family aminotransferase [unclassified Clostridium]EKQ57011.1 MAG: putative PLP-dependent enzyme possibly involved in cell wall biogenesis [Clostridium sp. Maddingley MBC34-26]